MGNSNDSAQDYITSFMPQICGGTSQPTDVNTELKHGHKTKNKRLKSGQKRKKPTKIKRKISPKKKAKQITHNRNKPSNNHLHHTIAEEGYVTGSTSHSTRSNTIEKVTANMHNIRLFNTASIPEVYRDEASALLESVKTERERQSGEHWLDKYESDTLYYVYNHEWTLCKITQMNDNSVCVCTDARNGTNEWIDKRSSKIKPYLSHHTNNSSDDSVNLKKNKRKLFIHQITLASPPILPCHTDKILYYFDETIHREYIVCCTEWTTFNSEYESGVYRYDINFGQCEYLGKYPFSPKNYFKATMDTRNQQLHIYCFPTWAILDLKSKQWNVTSINDSVKFNVINIQPSASVIIEGILYIFGNARCARFDTDLFMFKEIGFRGIDDRVVWDVNDCVFCEELNRLYIFGLSDSYPSFERMWYKELYYLDLNERNKYKMKWIKCEGNGMRLPYYTYGVFADYCALLGFKHFLFVFYHKWKELWIFDLRFNKRFKYTEKLQIEFGMYCAQIINARTNAIHSFCLDGNGPFHTKLSLKDLLKNVLTQYSDALKADLICGYIKRQFILSKGVSFPLKCAKIVFGYYPQMVDV